MNLKIKALFAVASLVVAGVGASSASAFTPWQYNHPGRVEVNSRLNLQNFRIREARMNGHLTAFQAFRLHQDDQDIRGQERFFASQHGGHLTRSEHRFLNHEENGVSHRI